MAASTGPPSRATGSSRRTPSGRASTPNVVRVNDFSWFDRLLNGIHTLRLVFATGQSAQDMLLVVAFNLSPPTTTETLDDQGSHPDQATIRAGEHDGWGYAVQTTVDPNDNDDQLARLSLRGEAFALVFTMTTDFFSYASDGAFVWGFDMGLPQMSPPHPRFAAQMAEAGFFERLPNPRVVGPRFVELAFGVTITPDMVSRPLASVVRPPQPPPPVRPTAVPIGIPRLPSPRAPAPVPAAPQPPNRSPLR